MKKLLLTSALFAISFCTSLQAQSPSPKIASTNTAMVVDTLHYYLNKYYFKTGNTTFSTFPSYRTDATALASFTDITYCGSKFEVPAGETVTITGLEAFAKKAVTTANLTIPIRLYLFKIDPTTGMPIMPPLDSVSASVGNNATVYPAAIGGSFVTARTMTTTYGVAMRNMSGASGDYAYLLRTNGVTQSNPNGPWRYSDGYGFVRFQGHFYSTTDFTMTAGFGQGTSYEFIVAPRVTYTVQASQIMPSGIVAANDTVNTPDTMCTRLNMTFTNTSSAFFEHRMYNLNQFYRKWNLYSPFPNQSPFSSDSSITWSFEFYDNQPVGHDSRVFLPYVNHETITASTGLSYYPQCFTANQFRARLKPMGAFGSMPQLIFNQDFIVCLMYCNGDTVGIAKYNNYDNLKVYPNPAVSGKTVISGLKGKNQVIVYNVIGEVVLKETTEENNMEVNLSKQPKGTYILRILNADTQQGKIVKILNY